METDRAFRNLEKEVQNRILKNFEGLEISNPGLINLKQRVKPTSATGTYLVNDNSLMGTLSALLIANTISYLGRLLAWAITFVMWIYNKIFKKIYK